MEKGGEEGTRAKLSTLPHFSRLALFSFSSEYSPRTVVNLTPASYAGLAPSSGQLRLKSLGTVDLRKTPGQREIS